jgi:uncharacterized membrane protein
MAYVDGLLVSDEKVIRREQQHWILPFYIAGKWVALAFVVFIVSLLLNWLLIPSGGGGFFGAIAGFISGVFTLVTIVALVIAAGGFIWSALRWRSQEYVLTDQRVIHVRGVITKQSSDSVLESLSDAKIVIPFLGRMMGWGNMILMTANESGNERMLALRDPIAFKKAVLEAKTARTLRMNTAAYTASVAASPPAPAPVAPPAYTPPVAAPAPGPAAASAEDVTRTLTALAGLRDSGAITPDEYEAKKKELLDRI